VNARAYGNSRRNLMSWFKRKPHVKELPKLHPLHYSPISQSVMKEAKKKVSGPDYSSGNNNIGKKPGEQK
jgi:hypothetical protein